MFSVDLNIINIDFSGPLSSEEMAPIVEEEPRNKRRPENADKGPMLNATRALLDSFYSPFNQIMAGLMQDDRFLYKSP